MTVEIWGKENCAFCTRAKALVESKGVDYVYKQLGKDFTREDVLEAFPGAKTFPQIKIDDISIGGYEELYDKVG